MEGLCIGSEAQGTPRGKAAGLYSQDSEDLGRSFLRGVQWGGGRGRGKGGVGVHPCGLDAEWHSSRPVTETREAGRLGGGEDAGAAL